MKTFQENISRVFHHKASIIFWVGALLLFGYLWFWLIDFRTIQWNLWLHFAWAEVLLHGILSILFGLFVSAQIYKFYYFKTINTKQNSWGILGGILGILITGCPSCSITLASYVWLASIFSLLPWYGLEVKIIGILLLLWVVWNSYRKLLVCKVKKKKT